MKAFQSTKVVHAYEATSTEWMRKREKLDPSKGAGYSDATLKDGIDGYIVVYNRCSDNEYWSWSPKEEFDKNHTEADSNRPVARLSSVVKYA